VNTPERGRKTALGLGIRSPVGHDARVDGARVSAFMQRYRTGGTPWTVVIDKRGRVQHGAFTPELAELAKLIDALRRKSR